MKRFLVLWLALIASAAFAATNKEIEGYFARLFANNPNYTFDKLRVIKREALADAKGWERADLNISYKPKDQSVIVMPVYRAITIFTYKGFIASEMQSLDGGVGDDKLAELARLAVSNNPNMALKSSRVIKRFPIKEIEGWEAIAMQWDIDIARGQGGEVRPVSEAVVWFAAKNYVAADIIRIESGESLKFEIKGDAKPEYYRDDHLVAGNSKAENKVLIFSDPLCPACRQAMPVLLKAASENPNKIALYYYAMPTHPVSPTLMQAAIASRLAGNKNAERAMYETDFIVRTGDDLEALKQYNATFGTKYELKDLNKEDVLRHYNADQKAASEMLISSTPSIFINGKFDPKRQEIMKLVNSLDKR